MKFLKVNHGSASTLEGNILSSLQVWEQVEQGNSNKGRFHPRLWRKLKLPMMPEQAMFSSGSGRRAKLKENYW